MLVEEPPRDLTYNISNKNIDVKQIHTPFQKNTQTSGISLLNFFKKMIHAISP